MTRTALAAALMILAACEQPRPRPPVYWTPPDAGSAEPQAPYCLRRFETGEVVGACTYAAASAAWNCLNCAGCTEADGGGEVCSR